ncbi:uncharacterized protein LOC120359295 isoform X2 [Solenopsis invicta]|uniref:uncharacterized protein LOC120359295 isoform X2 n=1 Tax=Solenopsis invicta TaxID=13686 RepID=UPI00193CDAF7|nr:uncharacterized protein LOC120359295 isoform X2 [Solenopsis invicta]
MFTVIQFDEKSGANLAVVSTKWLTPLKKEVFWPPYKNVSSFNKALKKHEDVNENEWTLYNVQRIFYETDNIEVAQKKAKEAENTSDLYTDVDCNTISKRKRQPPRRLYDSDNSSTEESQPISNFERPPPIKRINFNNSSQYINIIPDILTPRTLNSNELDEGAIGNKMLNILITIKEQNNQILAHIRNTQQARSVVTFTLPENLPLHLPLKTSEDVNLLEEYINDETNCSNLCSFLSSLGGRDTTNKTNKILKQLLTDDLCKNYSFYGKRLGKKSFSTLLMKNMVINAVKATTPGATNQAIEDSIKVWLKHAPQRIKKKSN